MENKKYGFLVKIDGDEGLMAVSDSETIDLTFRPSEAPSFGYISPDGKTISLQYCEITQQDYDDAMSRFDSDDSRLSIISQVKEQDF